MEHVIEEREDEEEGVSSYRMTLRKTERIRTLMRKLYIARCGDLAMEEAMELSSERLRSFKRV